MNNPPVQSGSIDCCVARGRRWDLVTKDKVLTARAIEAVKRLQERGVMFCHHERPSARGLRMFVEPLDLKVAMAAFNGGVLVRPDLSVIDEKPLPTDILLR